MDIAFVSNVVYPFVNGGAQRRIYEIGTRLEQRGHDTTVYCRQFWDGPEEIVHEGMDLCAVAPEAELYSNDRRSIPEAIEFSLRLAPTLRSHLKRDRHDVVVANVFPYFPVLSSKLTSLGTEIPLVTTWHEVWDDYWEEYLGSLAPFGKIVEQTTAKTPQHPVAISRITAEELAAIGPSRDSIDVVPNGIDTEEIQTAPLPDTGYDILFAGRLIEHKNVDLLLSAFDRVASSYDVTLGIIGDGPERESLERAATSLTHAGAVDFLGFLDDQRDVFGHMRAASTFVSPSTREGFGLTFAEAMAADCTVIGASHPNSAADEVIGDAGFLVEPTTDKLEAQLADVLDGSTPAVDPQAGAADHDWDRIADQALSIYEHAAARS